VVRPKTPIGPDEQLPEVSPLLKNCEKFSKKTHARASYSAPLSMDKKIKNRM
jgi:hypothetical protein